MQQDRKSNENEVNDIKRKQDDEISACFEAAKQKIGRVLTSKKQVIRDLAHELERLGRPVDHIAAEIVHELRECEELSKSLIYSYLDKKYKDHSHASRRKGKKTKNVVPETGTDQATEEDQVELAADQEAELKPEVLVQAETSGHSIQQKQSNESDHAETEAKQRPDHSTETGNIHQDISSSKPNSVTITQQETSSPQPDPSIGIGVGQPVCQRCRIELKEALKNHKATNSAFDYEVASPIKQNEDLAYTRTEVLLVSSIPIPFETLQKDLAAIFRRNSGKVGNIFFKISVDIGKLVGQIEFCGITQEKDVTMISTGKGILREAN
jgi:hypothetical protein